MQDDKITLYRVDTFGTDRWYFGDESYLEPFRKIAQPSGSDQRKCMSEKEKQALQALGVDFILKETKRVKDDKGQATGAYVCPEDGWTPPWQDDTEHEVNLSKYKNN